MRSGTRWRSSRRIPARDRLYKHLRSDHLRKPIHRRGDQDNLHRDPARSRRRVHIPANWRATIIPVVAIPVSLIGTFSILAALGASINNLSLFGLVLAVGIVVDDAIVVVENVERNMAIGMSPREAAHHTMDEVSGSVDRDRADPVRRFRPVSFHRRHFRAILQAVCDLLSQLRR